MVTLDFPNKHNACRVLTSPYSCPDVTCRQLGMQGVDKPPRWSMSRPRQTLRCAVPGQRGPLALTWRTSGTGAGRLSASSCAMHDTVLRHCTC